MRSLERRKGKGSRRSLVETQAASEEERKNITTNCSIGSVVAKQGLRRAKDTHEAVDGSSGSDSDTKMIMRGWHKIPATDAQRRSGCNSRALSPLNSFLCFLCLQIVVIVMMEREKGKKCLLRSLDHFCQSDHSLQSRMLQEP